jgi:Protein of unknown function (DUF3175)
MDAVVRQQIDVALQRDRGGGARPRAAAERRSPGVRPRKPAKWSKKVMEQSDALDLRPGVFKLKTARAIAASLKNSSEEKSSPQSQPFSLGDVHAQFRD